MDPLLPDIEAFIAAHRIGEFRFGIDAVNDKNLIRDMRAGRELRRSTERRIRQFMLTYAAPQSVAA